MLYISSKSYLRNYNNDDDYCHHHRSHHETHQIKKRSTMVVVRLRLRLQIPTPQQATTSWWMLPSSIEVPTTLKMETVQRAFVATLHRQQAATLITTATIVLCCSFKDSSFGSVSFFLLGFVVLQLFPLRLHSQRVIRHLQKIYQCGHRCCH